MQQLRLLEVLCAVRGLPSLGMLLRRYIEPTILLRSFLVKILVEIFPTGFAYCFSNSPQEHICLSQIVA